MCLSNTFNQTRYAAVTGYIAVPATVTTLMAAVLNQTVSIAVNAALNSFLYYSSGVYSDPACTPNNLNHAGN